MLPSGPGHQISNTTEVDKLKVTGLLLLLGIYFGSAQAQSSNVLNISCQGSGLVLFSADHNILQNSWKISPQQYCLIVYSQGSLSQQLRS